MREEVLLYSSGLDSYLAREYLLSEGHDFDCLYFYHNGRYCDSELDIIKCLPFIVEVKTDLNFKYIEEEDAFIPNRNILMTTMANSYGYNNIWIGGSKSDRVCDNNREVFDRLSKFLSTMNEKSIKISSPFWDVYKSDVMKWFRNYSILKQKKDLNVFTKELLNRTFSCFNPRSKTDFIFEVQNDGKIIQNDCIEDSRECLKCRACFRKNVALYSIGIFRYFHNHKIIDHYQGQIDNAIIKNPRMLATEKYIERIRDAKKEN